MMDELIEVGVLGRCHGVRGELKVIQSTEDVDLYETLKTVFLVKGEKQVAFTVENARPANKYWIFKFQEIADRNQAELYQGWALCVPESLVRPLEEDEFFIHDLVGADTYSTEGTLLGTIVSHFETGDQTIFEVKQRSGTFLFPATREILKEILPEQRKVIIDPPPGLLELNHKNSEE